MNAEMEAVRKINAEMQKRADDPYTEILGHYIIDRCGDAAVAALVLEDGKTLDGAMQAVTAAARKVKSGNVAVLTPDRVFGEVDKYFGLTTDTRAQQRAMMTAPGGGAATEQVEDKKPILDLTDFL